MRCANKRRGSHQTSLSKRVRLATAHDEVIQHPNIQLAQQVFQLLGQVPIGAAGIYYPGSMVVRKNDSGAVVFQRALYDAPWRHRGAVNRAVYQYLESQHPVLGVEKQHGEYLVLVACQLQLKVLFDRGWLGQLRSTLEQALFEHGNGSAFAAEFYAQSVCSRVAELDNGLGSLRLVQRFVGAFASDSDPDPDIYRYHYENFVFRCIGLVDRAHLLVAAALLMSKKRGKDAR